MRGNHIIRNEFLEYLSICTLLTVLAAITFDSINRYLPIPFMDEIFHARQAQNYCSFKFLCWDPMITTPPGLYLVSLLFLLLTPASCQCSLPALRAVNLIFAAGTFIVVILITRVLRLSKYADDNNNKDSNDQTELQQNWRPLLILLQPHLFPFLFLYYTDIGALFFILLTYYTILRTPITTTSTSILYSLLPATLALLFRQTSFLWIAGFFPADKIYREIGAGALDLSIAKSGQAHEWNRAIRSIMQALWLARKTVWRVLLPSLILTFIAINFVFLVNNKSIVFGDHSSHRVSLHLAQFFYCMIFIAILMAPLLPWKRLFTKRSRADGFLLFIFILLALLAVHYGTYEHPYLFIDDRHLTNLLWSALLYDNPALRYLLSVLYGFATFLIFKSLPNGLLWRLGFLLSVAMVTVPSPLIEPRYFIVPSSLFLLYLPHEKDSKATASTIKYTLMYYLIVDASLLILLLHSHLIW